MCVIPHSMKREIDWANRFNQAEKALLTNKEICKENRDLFKEYFDFQKRKLKRINGLRELDSATYKTLYVFITRFSVVNSWFQNKPWKDLTKEDILRVYDQLEEGVIKKKNGQPFKDRTTFYVKVFKGKPFALAGKVDLAREVIQYSTHKTQEVRFIKEEDFRRLVDASNKSIHRLLLWLSFDYGENINSLLKLRKLDFYKEINPHTKEPEYLLNLKKDILKRSRKARSELNNYRETYVLLDQYLSTLQDEDYLFHFGYQTAKKLIDRLVIKTGVKCLPNGEKVTWKDLRNSMACDLLKKGWTTDEVNARLGHTPSSDEIDKYVNFLAIDRKTPKQKMNQFELEKLRDELDQQKFISKQELQRRDEELYLLQEKIKFIELMMKIKQDPI